MVIHLSVHCRVPLLTNITRINANAFSIFFSPEKLHLAKCRSSLRRRSEWKVFVFDEFLVGIFLFSIYPPPSSAATISAAQQIRTACDVVSLAAIFMGWILIRNYMWHVGRGEMLHTNFVFIFFFLLHPSHNLNVDVECEDSQHWWWADDDAAGLPALQKDECQTQTPNYQSMLRR